MTHCDHQAGMNHDYLQASLNDKSLFGVVRSRKKIFLMLSEILLKFIPDSFCDNCINLVPY